MTEYIHPHHDPTLASEGHHDRCAQHIDHAVRCTCERENDWDRNRRQDRIRFHVRCCIRRGRTWGHTIAQVRRHFGWRLSSDVCARREWTRTNQGD